ncbi:MAG TPA: acyltransferase [Bacteroidia bacterium]|nr:acyltransferase [Bacteroidia bacterium]
MDPSQNKIVYFKNLDGLRAIAALCVIFAHLAYWLKHPDNLFFNALSFLMSFDGNLGRIGVICFFVLSGFLITYLMYAEQTKKGKLNIPFFYMRRIFRIWPLYFLTLIVGFVIYPLILKSVGMPYYENARWFWYAIFAANFDHIYNYFPTSNMLGVQWSVAVEEQFYLIWPILFVLLNKKKIFPWFLGLIIIASEIFSIQVGSHVPGGDYHLFSCIRYLSYGSLIAYWSYSKIESLINILNKINKTTTLLIYLVCMVLMPLQNEITKVFPTYMYLYHIVPVLFFSFIITEQNFSKNSFFKVGNFSILSWLGKISYGLYLTHMIAINIILAILPNNPNYFLLNALLSITLCICLSHYSYIYIEKYFLSWKEKFSSLGNNLE